MQDINERNIAFYIGTKKPPDPKVGGEREPIDVQSAKVLS